MSDTSETTVEEVLVEIYNPDILPRAFDWTKIRIDDRIVRIGRNGTDRSKVYRCQACKKVIPVGTVCNEVFTYYDGDLYTSGFFCPDCY